MKIAATICAALSLLTFNTAIAANEQTIPNSSSDWSGFYVGGEIGGGFGNSRKDFNDGPSTGDFTVDGVIGGVTAGYNKQWGNLVASLEGDFSGSGINGSTSCPNNTYTCETNTNWLATLRPRIGYALNNFIPYATGGLAIGDVNIHSFLNSTGGNGVDYTKTQIGWTAGAGVETLITTNWSLKAEYLYVQLADTNGAGNVPGSFTKTSFNENIIRLGVNYAFK